MTKDLNVSELQERVGTTLGVSPWRLIDQEQVNAFAEATGDWQWIHTDPERAAASRYGGTIVHGHLTLSLVPMMVRQVVDVKASVALNYGLNRCRFPSPLLTGSRIRSTVELVSAERRKDGGVMTIQRVTVEREGGEVPVCIAEVLGVVYQ